METRSSANLPPDFSPLDALLLERQSVLCLEPGSDNLPDLVMQALDINLAQIGFALSSQLSARLRTLSPAGAEQIWNQALPVLLAKVGGGQKHVPLLRHFPHDIPHDTTQLWVRKVLNHFAQASNQPA